MPPISTGDMEAQIELEAVNYIPYPIEEVNLDFEVIGSIPNPEMVQVLLAARSENVELRQSALELGLQAKVMDVEAFAVENALRPGRQRAAGIHRRRGRAGRYRRHHDHPQCPARRPQPLQPRAVFGGKQLTDEIMRRYGLSYEEAGLAAPGRPAGKLRDGSAGAVQGHGPADQPAAFFYAGSEFNRVDHIVLAGGCAVLGGLPEMVENSWACRPWSPTRWRKTLGPR